MENTQNDTQQVDLVADPLAQLLTVLAEVVLPRLHEMQASQAVQREQTNAVYESVGAFRHEMELRLAQIQAELVACRAQVEEAMADSHERRVAAEKAKGKRLLVN